VFRHTCLGLALTVIALQAQTMSFALFNGSPVGDVSGDGSTALGALREKNGEATCPVVDC
jgi:hypothetical protein